MSGAAGGPVKYVYCLRRNPAMTPEEFRSYWGERHAKMIRGYAEVLTAKRYVQSHPYDTPLQAGTAGSRGLGVEPFDGVTEIWLEDEADFVAAVSTPEGKAAAERYVADEANFVDFSRSTAFLTREVTVFDLARKACPRADRRRTGCPTTTESSPCT